MIRKGALLDLIFVNRESLMDEMVISAHHGNGDHEVVKFKILGDRRKTVTKTSTLNIRRTDFRLLRELVVNIPWETAFEGTGLSTAYSKYNLLSAQGPGNSTMPEVKQGQKASWAQQGSSSEPLTEKESTQLLEARSSYM